MVTETLTLTEALSRAVGACDGGRFDEAERLCAAILGVEAGNVDAICCLAITQYLRGRRVAALVNFDKALVLRPDHVGALNNRGIILQELGRFAEALACFDRILALQPGDRDALNNRAMTLQRMGRLEEALAGYDDALAVAPDYLQALNNRGVLLKDMRRFAEALSSLDRILALRPKDAMALNNRGIVFKELERFDAALADYDGALAVRPDYAEAHNNRGNVLNELGRLDEAVASYDRALAIRPDYVDALTHRGNVLTALKRHAEALACHDKALELRPDFAEALHNRGCTLEQLHRYADALANYDRALAIRPTYADALVSRGRALLHLRRLAEAGASYAQALACDPAHRFAVNGLADCAVALCDWQLHDRLAADVRRHVVDGGSSVTPFVMLFYSDDPALQLACARRYIGERIRVAPPPLWRGERWRNDRIRLAYVSADFRQHPVASLTAELLERHDRSRFEVIGVSLGPDDGSAMRARLIRAFDRFHDVRAMSDRDVARLLHDLRTDIVVDLAGYTLDCRPEIFACRPAPIAVGYLGFPATTGADFIDYILADKIIVPFDQQAAFSEKIVHLPDSFQPNESQCVIADAPTRRDAGLPDTGFVFCCFNNHTKLAAPVFDAWMRLLGAVDGSVLWLSQAPAEAAANLRRAAAVRGIDSDRLIFAPRTVRIEDHFARHRLADLFLDTLPYNAHATASDALRAGLPVLTCLGRALAGRVAASLLEAAGLPELVTHDLAEYESLALRLAGDAPLLAGYRARLERNRLTCALFDGNRFRRHIEAAYVTMWEAWQRGDAPRGFSVVPSAPRG